MSKYYSRSGDDGTTGLLGNERVPKDHARIEAVGSIDETNAALGIIRSQIENNDIEEIIITIQRDLYYIMAEVSATQQNAAQFRKLDNDRVAWLEDQIEIIGNQIQTPGDFIIPGDNVQAAFLDFARTVVRRAERRTTTLIHNSALENEYILPYLNRLSSLCFLLEILKS